MREVIEKVYSVTELSEKAREKAYHDWCSSDYYPHDVENVRTLDKFADIFDITNLDWEYGYRKYIYFSTSNECSEELKGIRLMKYIYNNYFKYITKGKYYSKGKLVDGKYVCKCRHSKIMLQTDGCPLTGFYMDYIILKPIFEFLNNPHKDMSYYDLMQECLEAWINACEDDYDYYYSMDNFIDMAEGNEWEYYEDGEEYF